MDNVETVIGREAAASTQVSAGRVSGCDRGSWDWDVSTGQESSREL